MWSTFALPLELIIQSICIETKKFAGWKLIRYENSQNETSKTNVFPSDLVDNKQMFVPKGNNETKKKTNLKKMEPASFLRWIKEDQLCQQLSKEAAG